MTDSGKASSNLKSPQRLDTPLPSQLELLQLPQQKYNIDGRWKCISCSSQNSLKYSAGLHPFAHMKCHNCGDIWNPSCNTTSVLRRFLSKAEDPVAIPKFEGRLREEIPFFCICNDCGQTWRAKYANMLQKLKAKNKKATGKNDVMKESGTLLRTSLVRFGHMKCDCGATYSTDWYRFSVRHDAYFRVGYSESGYYYLPKER
ncbi:hypothetical protein CC78DRAFT_542537 [Lojkania enalia]|uniref:Probable double zinc ribbon domain-containing protein n=1 Tax=Lojkania enalia TaxID=147567 RepID=A0A9P4KEA3_9PLEO|nr:hypothetical protein CC78DRAFT_542537 [Didymosphaeria enalia]